MAEGQGPSLEEQVWENEGGATKKDAIVAPQPIDVSSGEYEAKSIPPLSPLGEKLHTDISGFTVQNGKDSKQELSEQAAEFAEIYAKQLFPRSEVNEGNRALLEQRLEQLDTELSAHTHGANEMAQQLTDEVIKQLRLTLKVKLTLAAERDARAKLEALAAMEKQKEPEEVIHSQKDSLAERFPLYEEARATAEDFRVGELVIPQERIGGAGMKRVFTIDDKPGAVLIRSKDLDSKHLADHYTPSLGFSGDNLVATALWNSVVKHDPLIQHISQETGIKLDMISPIASTDRKSGVVTEVFSDDYDLATVDREIASGRDIDMVMPKVRFNNINRVLPSLPYEDQLKALRVATSYNIALANRNLIWADHGNPTIMGNKAHGYDNYVFGYDAEGNLTMLLTDPDVRILAGKKGARVVDGALDEATKQQLEPYPNVLNSIKQSSSEKTFTVKEGFELYWKQFFHENHTPFGKAVLKVVEERAPMNKYSAEACQTAMGVLTELQDFIETWRFLEKQPVSASREHRSASTAAKAAIDAINTKYPDTKLDLAELVFLQYYDPSQRVELFKSLTEKHPDLSEQELRGLATHVATLEDTMAEQMEDYVRR